jgi:hypothetical protein
MSKKKIMYYLGSMLLVSIFVVFWEGTAFAADLGIDPIVGEPKVKTYEIKVVATPNPSNPKIVKLDETRWKITIPVEGTDNSLIRGVQVDLNNMGNIALDFYDQGVLIDHKECTVLNRYSKPTNSDTLIIKVVSPRTVFKNKSEFNFGGISYTIDEREESEKKVKIMAHNGFEEDKDITDFKNKINQFKIGSPVICSKTEVADGSNPYDNKVDNVLLFPTHSNPNEIYLGENTRIGIYELADSKVSKFNWIFQLSCFAVNQEAARYWCEYLDTDEGSHVIKGVFGYSTFSYDVGWSDKFLKYSQRMPLLSTLMYNNAEKFKKSRSGVSLTKNIFDPLAYTTAIINESNIYDSMFDISVPRGNKYRLYRFIKNYGDVVLTGEKLGKVRITDRVVSGGVKVTYSFGETDKYLSIRLTKPALEKGKARNIVEENEKEYLSNYLNNLSLDDFDKLMKDSAGQEQDVYTMDTLSSEIKTYRTNETAGAYKQLVLNWLTHPLDHEPNTNNGVLRPLVESLKSDAKGYPIVEYAVLEKNYRNNYDFITNDKKEIIWTQAVLERYSYEDEVKAQ